MKKYITTILLSILSICAVAQNYKSARIGLVEENGEYSLSYPTTTIVVELLVEKTDVTPGIYARYAQKYLAMRAPLVAQSTYKIIDSSIYSSEEFTPEQLTPQAVKVSESKLPADQNSSFILAPEDAARDAAAAIFTIRNQRREIINGEAGEGYFGAGLKDAMDRLDALEQEYMELFMGRTEVSQSVEKHLFKPQAGATRHVVARFDVKSGVVSANDLSGTPIHMQFIIQDMPNTSAIEAEKRVTNKALFRIAAPTQCVLYNDSTPISATVLSIFEFGKTIEVILSGR